MNPLIQAKNTTILSVLIALTLGRSRSPSAVRLLLVAGLSLITLGGSSTAWAVCQEGCSPNANTFLGDDALINNIGFGFNTAIGYHALYNNTTGEQNTAVGQEALSSNTTGFGNVAIGNYSLVVSNGSRNVAIHGMEGNTTGNNNTAVGFASLDGNATGSNNTAIGYEAGFANTFSGTGSNNTVTGYQAFHSYTSGSFNAANGTSALYANTTGGSNTADGAIALGSNTIGSNNTGIGFSALGLNNSGANNTAVGRDALLRNITGSSNIAVGYGAGQNLTTGNNNIHIGHAGVAGEANKIHIGTVGIQNRTFIAGVSGVTVPAGVGVIIGTDGKLGTVVSSERFKGSIKPMAKASEAILALKPVTFHYKHELDPEGIAQFGLVAEEVEKVNPDLVARDDEGKAYTVRYEAVNAMLLNEFLKARRQIDAQQNQIDTLTAGLQKVSAQLELSKPAPQTVLNNQ